VNDTVEIYIPDTEYVQIDINEYEYTVCDFQLPYNTTKEIILGGNPNQTVQTSYNINYFDLEDEFKILDNGYKTINIIIHLKNLSLGKYTEIIKFNIVSVYDNITFHFNIIDCAVPFTPCYVIYEEMNVACSVINKTIIEMLECKRLEVNYNKCVYDAMLDASETRVINHTIVEYVNSTTYQPVLSLEDKDLLDAIKKIPTIASQLIADARRQKTEIDEKNKQIADLLTEKDASITSMNEKIGASAKPLVDTVNTLQGQINVYKNSYIKKSALIVWGIVLLILSSLVLLFYNVQINSFW